MTKAFLRILGLGAGVQSTAMYLMADAGEFSDRPDYAIFADTGWEPQAVYKHLDWLEGVGRIPIYRAKYGDLRADVLDTSKRSASLPLYVLSPQGKQGIMRRQCTQEYKINPIRSLTRMMLLEHGIAEEGKRIPPASAEQWIGISRDEAGRMADSKVAYITNRYPLVDAGLSRQDCLNWLKAKGYPEPPKSACIGCPFHRDKYWHQLKTESPVEFADAVDFDNRIRSGATSGAKGFLQKGQTFLHRSLKPLSEVDLRTPEESGQEVLEFGEECEGMCGV